MWTFRESISSFVMGTRRRVLSDPMRSAFVSHSTSDDSFVAEMESFLRAAGFEEVFNDVSAIRPDEKFWPEIEKGITSCDTFVVVITSASNASEWVKRESNTPAASRRRSSPSGSRIARSLQLSQTAMSLTFDRAPASNVGLIFPAS